MAKTPDALVAMALSQVGYNRYTDPEEGTKYGRWYAKLTNSPWFGTTGVPYCAMFVSWCLYQLGIKCCGCPTASCTSGLLTAARKAGKLKPPSQGKRGDLVLFDWSERGYYAPEADHVGICEWNYSSYTDTIEGNVAGKVETRRRSHSCIVGFITPEFETSKEEEVYGFKTIKRGSKGNEVMLLQSALNIRMGAGFALDADFGSYTEQKVKEWQRQHGLYADGICGAKTWPTVLGK